ncbi:MAG: metallophosphoesterase [Ottowia sp.]|uniref:metallophosphoesterase n=1 Tax=Ottowia sp. TaxID=1898956 RepID=UPI003C71E69B
MRIFALSDIHVDYEPNMAWVQELSRFDYVDDLLILAGDISHKRQLLDTCLSALTRRFRHVLFVPGNHDLWVAGETPEMDSLEKFAVVRKIASSCGATMETIRLGGLLVVPLLGWYDYSFGQPQNTLLNAWTDYRACRWPAGYGAAEVAAHFDNLNTVPPTEGTHMRITVSHFLPRIDLIPSFVSSRHRILDPVLGSTRLEGQLRKINPKTHVYGHSHINQSVWLDGIRYINNAFGYPQESRITAKQLLCIEEV